MSFIAAASIILLLNAVTEFNQSVWMNPSEDLTMAIHCEDGSSLYLQYTPLHGVALEKDGSVVKVFSQSPFAEEIGEFVTSSVTSYNLLKFEHQITVEMGTY